MICETVKKHLANNNGFDINWLRKHQANCKTCKQLTSIISAAVDEIVYPLTTEVAHREGSNG